MTFRRDHKVPGGKLLRIELELEGSVVARAEVRGDFFAHPEEAFEAAEQALSGAKAEDLGRLALGLFSKPPLRIFGAAAADIAQALEEALREAQAD
jgi:lipoate---protein ligase